MFLLSAFWIYLGVEAGLEPVIPARDKGARAYLCGVGVLFSFETQNNLE